ncbi:MAG: hypothetical protein RLZZ58_2176, partial [Pseudomonadota bacterium]
SSPAIDPVHEDAYYDDAVLADTVAGTAIELAQTDTLDGFEANGGPVTLSGDLFVGNPVICISPKRLPGIWTKQNGYTGDKCTTAWFTNPSIAWNASTTSQGTYISVPAF